MGSTRRPTAEHDAPGRSTDMSALPTLARWALNAALIAMTVVAGLCVTFMVAVMPALAGVDDDTFVLVTRRFNENPVFPFAFSTALVLLVLATGLCASAGRGASSRWAVVALAAYVSALAITGLVHLPLNAMISGRGDDAAALRSAFEQPWIAWNTARTALCMGAVAALARAISWHGRDRGDRP